MCKQHVLGEDNRKKKKNTAINKPKNTKKQGWEGWEKLLQKKKRFTFNFHFNYDCTDFWKNISDFLEQLLYN